MSLAESLDIEWSCGEGGAAEIAAIRLGRAETAWLCYALAQAGEADRAAPMLDRLKREIEARISAGLPVAEQGAYLDAAYWLWAYGVCRSAGWQGLAASDACLSAAVTAVADGWRTPCGHWLGGMDGEDGSGTAVWFANLAVAYGGLLAVQPHLPQENGRIQQTLMQIREMVFAKFIRDEKIVSRMGASGIDGDIVMSAVPFGLLGIEDRILVEALYIVERELASPRGLRLRESDAYYGGCERPDLTGLLAWYYAEKGDLARAKSLLAGLDGQLERNRGVLLAVDPDTAREPLYAEYCIGRLGEPPVSPLAMVLHSLAKRSLAAKLTGGSTAATRVHFLHEPTGTEDPYVHYVYERFPRHPLAGDFVRVRTVTQPFRADQRIELRFRVNEGPEAAVPMTAGRTAEGEDYWEAPLRRFAAGDRVAYRFAEADEGGESREYEFRVRTWAPIGPLAGWERLERGMRLFFRPLSGAVKGTSLLFDGSAPETALRLHFEGQSDTLAAPMDGEENEQVEHFGDWALHLFRTPAGSVEFAIDWRGHVLLQSYGKHGQPPVELLTDGNGGIHAIRCNYRLGKSDRLYGMGERYSSFEYRGMTVDNYVYNEYRSQGMRTYMPVPFVINTHGYGLYVRTPMYSAFDFGETLADRMQIMVLTKATEPSLEWFILPGRPLDAVRAYTSLTGKPALPPKWAFGPWMSSNNWDSQAEALKQAARTRELEIPATVFVLEQWSDEATFYIFNDARYEVRDGREALRYEDYEFPSWGRWSDPKAMVESLHEDGLRVLLWQIPIHKYMYGVAHGQRDADEAAMLAGGYHVRTGNGESYRIPYNWFKDSLVIDFTNEEASRWWFEKRKYLLTDIGVDGFKTDGGECVFGPDLQFADGRTGAEMRNLYPNKYIGSYYRFVQEHVPGGGITFSRAGYAGAQNYPLHWAGDERSTFQAFRSSLHAGLSSGLSGIPFWGWDLAGFHGDIPTAELYIRSVQMAAFCPVMQYHAETKGEFNQDRTPWNIAERTGRAEVIPLFKRYADLRMNLLPYIYAQAVLSSREGVPMMRPMFAEFPDDPSCLTMYGQYFFGDSLLVAPVIEEGHFTKTVYFPEGRWLPLMGGGGETAGGRYETVRADLTDIPVYIRENAVVALNLNASLELGGHVGNRVDDYERLTFCLYLTGETRYRFDDDLGSEVSLEARKEAGRVIIDARSNREEPVYLWLRGCAGASRVSGNGQTLRQVGDPGEMAEMTYLLRDGEPWIRIDGPGATLVLEW